MGIFPCDMGDHRYIGRQQTIYPALLGGGFSTRRKLRLCDVHFAEYVAMLDARAQRADQEQGEFRVALCLLCGNEVDLDALQFFATVYATGQDRADYWAPLHESCDAATREDWLLATEST